MKIKAADKFLVLANGAYFPQIRALAIGDLHLGFEESLRREGISLPISQLSETKKLAIEMLEILKDENLPVEKIIINGDLKHEFSKLSEQEHFEAFEFTGFLKLLGLEVLLVQGNHDKYLAKVASRQELFISKEIIEEKILFCHGHELPKLLDEKEGENIELVVISHEHPAVAIRDEIGARHKFKCALFGKWKYGGKDKSKKSKRKELNLLVLPAISPLAAGTTINEASKFQLLSPILAQCNLDEFVPFVIDGNEVKEFPKLKHLH